MAQIVIKDNNVYLLEKNGVEHFYKTLEDYNAGLNKISDPYKEKLDLLGEMVADLWISSQGGL